MPDAAHPEAEVAAQLRVTYAEVDKMGVAYYGHYLRWFEVGRAELMRARGKPYIEIEAEGFKMPVVEAYVRYRASAAYDDEIEIHTRAAEVAQVTVKLAYRVTRKADGKLLAEGTTLHACLGKSGRPRRFPQHLLAVFRGE